MIGLPFTLYSLPYALRSALSALRHGGSSKLGPFMSNHVSPFPLHVLFAYCNLPSLPADLLTRMFHESLAATTKLGTRLRD